MLIYAAISYKCVNLKQNVSDNENKPSEVINDDEKNLSPLQIAKYKVFF